MKKFLSNKILLLILRLIIGGLFVIASIDKIIDPGHFKIIVSEYGILPDRFIPAFVIILPWIELIAGLMLILNQYSQSNALIIICLLTLFIIAIGINIVRGVSSDCGCFDLLGLNEKIGYLVIIRDFLMIILTLPIFIFSDNKFCNSNLYY